MASENYTRTIRVAADVETAYWALTEGMHAWWTTPDAPMTKIGDRSKFTFPPGKSYWTFEAAALEPGRRVEMVCVDACHLHEGQPKEIEREWLGSRVIWDISPTAEGAELALEHQGLTSALHCFDICVAGWDLFFVDSLQAYLDTGTGKPHRGWA